VAPPALLGLLTLCLLALGAATARAEPDTPWLPPVTRAPMPGGLRVVMNVDRSAPLVVAAMSYLAGTIDEPDRRSGVARLVERMMFAGGGQVGDGQHEQSIAALGGWTTVARTAEVTSYINVVPPEGLPLVLWLEGQRMASLTVEPPALARERARLLVARDEQRWRYGPASSRAQLLGLALQGDQHHGGATLNALETITAAEVKTFHQSHYGPARAVLTVVGDFDPAAVLAAVERYVDPIRRATPSRRPRGKPSAQTTRRASSLVHRGAHRGTLAFGWAIVGRDHPDHAALEVAGELLAGGRPSALYQQLVVADGKAFSVQARTERLKQSDLLGVYIELPRGTTPHDVALEVEREARQLGQRGPQPEALLGAQRALRTRQLSELAGKPGRAHRLSAHELTRAGTAELTETLSRHQTVTAADVRRVTAQYLVPHRSSVVEALAVPIVGKAKSADGNTGKKGKAKKTTKGKRKGKAKKTTKGKRKGKAKKTTKGKRKGKAKKATKGKPGTSAKKPRRGGKGP